MRLDYILILIVLSFACACFKSNDDDSNVGPSSNFDLHPSENISIVRSNDGLERAIRVTYEWLGDRYSDPKFECEASSIERLLIFLAEKTDQPIDAIEGNVLLPPGTYSYSFCNTTWKNEKAIFNDVLKATEEAFDLQIYLQKRNGKTWLIVCEDAEHANSAER